jgi:hypothetical protein
MEQLLLLLLLAQIALLAEEERPPLQLMHWPQLGQLLLQVQPL